ncbi:unnamed protein product [Polarella glacialis]|uniref:Uncharacterized protein n=1 Tax=Polarella glacialis TaxID=89957 RepID=A0A813KEU4_POLGL|nr:unnamed protein product [Polarella glacialis]
METIEGLRGSVSTRDLGNFYFLLEERRVVTLIELLIRRTSATEALLCLQAVEDPGSAVGQKAPVGHHLVVEGEGEQEAGEVERNKFFWEDMEQAFKSTWKLSETAAVASDALAISTRARANAVQQAERLQNVATERWGRLIGETLGEIYGNLFAKDLLWMFRAASRTQRFPVLLVKEAEEGSYLAQCQIATSMVFESELCACTLPRVLPSIRPAFTAGFEIGAAVGRNRAVNFKRLWIDAFLGSFLKQLWAVLRIRFQRVKGSAVRWDDLGYILRDSVVKGQSARRVVLTKFGRLPTTYDQNDPQVLKLLPSQWVPDIGLPLASGIGRGFFKRLKTGFKKGWRRQYVRPRFETWDVNDVPQFLLDCARQQGAEQAALVASSVGDTLARDVGWTVGSVVGAAWGLTRCLLGRSEDTAPDKGRVVVAGGYLESDKELLALEDYMREASQD